jgi:hypothetical protein
LWFPQALTLALVDVVADAVAFSSGAMRRDARGVRRQAPDFWIGRLSRSVTLALEDLRDDRPRVAREHLQATIREFLSSPVSQRRVKDDLEG